MAKKVQRRAASRRKLQLLRTLTNSKSVIQKLVLIWIQKAFLVNDVNPTFFSPLFLKVRRRSIILNVLLHFHKLKVKLEEIQREYQNLMAIRNEYFNLLKHIQIPKEVKVEKLGEDQFVVKVRCNRGGDKLVSIVEAFEELGLNVVRARVCCNHFFSMEAIVVAQDQQTTKTKDVTQAILKAIDKQGGERILVT